MTKHAIYSPSGFKALMLCPAKPAMERDLPDQSSDYSAEGTAAHTLGSDCLVSGGNAADHIGRIIEADGRTFVVDDDMAEAVQVYIDLVRSRMEMYRTLGATVELHVEQSLPIGHITGEEGAEGTGDAVIIAVFPDGHALVEVIDLKFGKGVEVDALANPQLMLYALGAIEKFSMVYDFTQASMLISQPRITWAPSEFAMPADELAQWGKNVAGPAAGLAQQIYEHGTLMSFEVNCNPQPEACRFCKAKGHCPALAQSVEAALDAEFTDLTTADKVEQEQIVKSLTGGLSHDQLGAKMDAVELIEMWCKAIRGRVEKQLLDGVPVAGYKLVAGRKSPRAWLDPIEAEAALKSMRLKKDEMYDLKLISPTTAEKVLKDSPKRWKKAQALIGQSEGKPSVAPVSDKRAALEIKPVASEFEAIAEDVGDLV